MAAAEHPEFDFLEQPMGERTEMFYVPQRSPLPANLGGERWTADRTVEEIAKSHESRPFFGFVSFVGPQPLLAPPIPFNRMYNPDRLPKPVLGKIEEDHLDEEIPFMRHAIWADAINPALTKIVKARNYGEVTYLDYCLGRILDAIEARPNSENVLICFFRPWRSAWRSSRLAETKFLRGGLPSPSAAKLARCAARGNRAN